MKPYYFSSDGKTVTKEEIYGLEIVRRILRAYKRRYNKPFPSSTDIMRLKNTYYVR